MVIKTSSFISYLLSALGSVNTIPDSCIKGKVEFNVVFVYFLHFVQIICWGMSVKRDIGKEIRMEISLCHTKQHVYVHSMSHQSTSPAAQAMYGSILPRLRSIRFSLNADT